MHHVDKNGIRIFLESSPGYPNLLSVMHTLRYANLDVQAGQCDWDYLRNLKSPFLMHIKLGSQEQLIIAKWDENVDSPEEFWRVWLAEFDRWCT